MSAHWPDDNPAYFSSDGVDQALARFEAIRDRAAGIKAAIGKANEYRPTVLEGPSGDAWSTNFALEQRFYDDADEAYKIAKNATDVYKTDIAGYENRMVEVRRFQGLAAALMDFVAALEKVVAVNETESDAHTRKTKADDAAANSALAEALLVTLREQRTESDTVYAARIRQAGDVLNGSATHDPGRPPAGDGVIELAGVAKASAAIPWDNPSFWDKVWADFPKFMSMLASAFASGGGFTWAGVALSAGVVASLAMILGLSGSTSGKGMSPKTLKKQEEHLRSVRAAQQAYVWTHGFFLDGRLLNEAGKPLGDVPGDDSASPKDAQEVKDYLGKNTRPGVSGPNREVDTPEELEKVFEEITKGGKPIDPPPGYKGETFVELPDGTRIGYRGGSSSGGDTIDIFRPPGNTSVPKYVKVHLPLGWGK